MADIAMCNNGNCEQKDGCLRFIEMPNEYMQSYILNPIQECEEKGWELFVEVK